MFMTLGDLNEKLQNHAFWDIDEEGVNSATGKPFQLRHTSVLWQPARQAKSSLEFDWLMVPTQEQTPGCRHMPMYTTMSYTRTEDGILVATWKRGHVRFQVASPPIMAILPTRSSMDLWFHSALKFLAACPQATPEMIGNAEGARNGLAWSPLRQGRRLVAWLGALRLIETRSCLSEAGQRLGSAILGENHDAARESPCVGDLPGQLQEYAPG